MASIKHIHIANKYNLRIVIVRIYEYFVTSARVHTEDINHLVYKCKRNIVGCDVSGLYATDELFVRPMLGYL